MEVREVSADYLAQSVPKVPKGYKQTEVGVIPEEWDVCTLGALGTFSKGQGIRKNEANSGEIPCIRYGEIYTHHSDIIRLYNSRISAAVAMTSKRLRKGDILFAGSGETKEEIGKCVAFVDDGDVYAGSDIVVLSPNNGSSEFFGYLLNAPLATRQKASKGQGDAVVHISSHALSTIAIPLPPLSEQRAIAAALSDVDALLAKLDQLIAKKRDLKQAAMQQLLTGQTRLPGFSREWEVKRLGDVIEKIIGGGTPSRANPRYWGNEIPWVTVKDFATFNPYETQEAITKEGLQKSASNLIPKGTLITSTRMALGKAVIYEVDVSINQDLKALFPKTNINTKYLFYWFTFHAKFIEDLGSGSTVKGICLGDLKAIPFLLSSFEEQTAIAEVLSDMDAEIGALEARRKKTHLLKQGMMQELLTGRIRLV